MTLNIYFMTALAIFFLTEMPKAFGQVTDRCGHSNIQLARWLLGTWKSETQKGSLYESWQQQDKGLLLGKSYFLKAGDTIMLETIKLTQLKDGLFYLPSVKNQNNGKEVAFKASSVTTDTLVFDNPMHDFPQKIGYYRLENNSLRAEISGYKNGKHEVRTFLMKRIDIPKLLK